MELKKYQRPIMEFTEFNFENIITTSTAYFEYDGRSTLRDYVNNLSPDDTIVIKRCRLLDGKITEYLDAMAIVYKGKLKHLPQKYLSKQYLTQQVIANRITTDGQQSYCEIIIKNKLFRKITVQKALNFITRETTV